MAAGDQIFCPLEICNKKIKLKKFEPWIGKIVQPWVKICCAMAKETGFGPFSTWCPLKLATQLLTPAVGSQEFFWLILFIKQPNITKWCNLMCHGTIHQLPCSLSWKWGLDKSPSLPLLAWKPSYHLWLIGLEVKKFNKYTKEVLMSS